MLQFTFVIPTYNRAFLVTASIASALKWIGESGDCEIILVDDASTDDTVQRVRHSFSAPLFKGLLRIISVEQNAGVTRAKNVGGRSAQGQWLIFLDSDDSMLAESAPQMRSAISRNRDASIVFFRCVDYKTGKLIGMAESNETTLSLKRYLNGWNYGECLPCVRRDVFQRFPFDERFRGFEGLAYARICRDVGGIVVSPVEARIYRSEGQDRLCARPTLVRRSGTLARGHLQWLIEFAPALTFSNIVLSVAKVSFYSLRYLVFRTSQLAGITHELYKPKSGDSR